MMEVCGIDASSVFVPDDFDLDSRGSQDVDPGPRDPLIGIESAHNDAGHTLGNDSIDTGWRLPVM
jgi:hypothetical protein